MQIEKNARKLELCSSGMETFSIPVDLVSLLETSEIEYREMSVPARQYIYRQGDRGDRIFILKSGYVEIMALMSAGQETIIDLLGPSALCGEGAAFDGAPRLTSARAIADCTLLHFGTSDVWQLLGQNSPLVISLINAISLKQRMLLKRLTQITQLPPEKRVLHLLVQISSNTADGSVNVSHEKLAHLIGLTRVTVTRSIGKLEKRGVLIRRDGKIFLSRDVCDPDFDD